MILHDRKISRIGYGKVLCKAGPHLKKNKILLNHCPKTKENKVKIARKILRIALIVFFRSSFNDFFRSQVSREYCPEKSLVKTVK